MTTELLQSCGLRCTHRRQLILDILSRSEKPMTAEEIHAEAIRHDRIGFSTTYRVLAQLTEHQLLLKNDGGDGRSYYQIASAHAHKHTLHCIRCGAVVSICDCPLAELESRLSQETGYLITGHSLTFTGICPHCRQSGDAGTVPHCCPQHGHE